MLGRRIGYRFAPAADHQEAWPGEEAWLGEQKIARPGEPAPLPWQADRGEAIGEASAGARTVETQVPGDSAAPPRAPDGGTAEAILPAPPPAGRARTSIAGFDAAMREALAAPPPMAPAQSMAAPPAGPGQMVPGAEPFADPSTAEWITGTAQQFPMQPATARADISGATERPGASAAIPSADPVPTGIVQRKAVPIAPSAKGGSEAAPAMPLSRRAPSASGVAPPPTRTPASRRISPPPPTPAQETGEATAPSLAGTPQSVPMRSRPSVASPVGTQPAMAREEGGEPITAVPVPAASPPEATAPTMPVSPRATAPAAVALEAQVAAIARSAASAETVARVGGMAPPAPAIAPAAPPAPAARRRTASQRPRGEPGAGRAASAPIPETEGPAAGPQAVERPLQVSSARAVPGVIAAAPSAAPAPAVQRRARADTGATAGDRVHASVAATPDAAAASPETPAPRIGPGTRPRAAAAATVPATERRSARNVRERERGTGISPGGQSARGALEGPALPPAETLPVRRPIRAASPEEEQRDTAFSTPDRASMNDSRAPSPRAVAARPLAAEVAAPPSRDRAPQRAAPPPGDIRVDIGRIQIDLPRTPTPRARPQPPPLKTRPRGGPDA